MSDEQLIKEYSKRWGVPLAEAKEKLESFFKKKPGKNGEVDPESPFSFGELFDPKSPFAKKLMGINQAALHTAYTRKILQQSNLPPKEIEGLEDKIAAMEERMNNVLDFVNTTTREMHDDLKARKEVEDRQNLINEIKTTVFDPLKEQVDALTKRKEGEPGEGEPLTIAGIIEAGKKATENARSLLEKQGFKVDVPKAMTKEEAEALVEKKLQLKKKEWEEKSGAEAEIEKERIRATEQILTTTVDRVFNIFLEPLKDEIHKAIKSGAFQKRGPK
jgi:hypothetical protein